MKLAALLLSVPLVWCIGLGTAQDDFDHFWLVQTWPSGYCASRVCKKPPPIFVIHGLWPVTANGKTVNASKPPNINVRSQIENDSPLQTELNIYWKSLTHKTYTSFWVREWEKHGSISSFNPLDYFRRTIQLTKNIDVLDVLKEAGIEPSLNGTTYPKSRYRNAINAVTRIKSVIFKCYSSIIGDLLEEVMFCTDKQARNFIPCSNDELRAEKCGPTIKFIVRRQ